MAGKHYVLGFGFSSQHRYTTNVAEARGSIYVDVPLHFKTTGPKTAQGWNTFGGEVEPYESPYQAVAREYTEECGIDLEPSDWNCIDSRWFENGNLLTTFVVSLTEEEIESCGKLSDKGEAIMIHRFRLNPGGFPVIRPISAYDNQAMARSMSYLLPMVANWLLYPDHRPVVEPLTFHPD